MNQVYLALALAALTACSTHQPSPRFVELQGAAAEPYATLGEQRWVRTKIVMSRREEDRISREVFGHPLDPRFVGPSMPGWSGPHVFRDTATGHIVTDYGIGSMFGFFEVAFTQSTPPKVAKTYFTDYDRTVQLPDIVALSRLTRQRDAQRVSQ